ncbi:hypothetical protein HD806DRAFT_364287 [Xylariaceae sp. AK1471]|nr:hypothetical protein HD806DRAFT_364287 [Xylariaceae sp. AK1471]
MEVVGAVAATTQLFGMAVKILESIAHLHDFIEHVPARYHGWDTELTLLGETIACIQRNSALHTCHVVKVIEIMTPKIESLALLCRQHTPPPKASRLTKVLRGLSARAVEPRILQSFQSLEQDKTTLILAVNLPIVPSSVENIRPSTEDMSHTSFEDIRGSPANSSSSNSAGCIPSSDSLGPVQKIHNNVSLPRRDETITYSHLFPSPLTGSPTTNEETAQQDSQIICNPQASNQWRDMPPIPLPTPPCTTQRGNFRNIAVSGNRWVIGTTMGPGADIVDSKFHGHDGVFGDHTPDVVTAAIKSRPQATPPEQTEPNAIPIPLMNDPQADLNEKRGNNNGINPSEKDSDESVADEK